MARSSLRLLPGLLLVGALVAACDSGAPRAMDEPADNSPVAANEGSKAGDEEQSDAPVGSRMVIRSATLQLRSESPEAVIARATQLAERVGGYVGGSNTTGVGSEIQQVDATLRVPSDRFQAVLQALRAEGELLHESLAGEDVTEQHTDLTARLRSKRTLEERLLTILSRVESVEDALRVETELTSVRTEIERLEGTKQGLEHRVSLATIELSVRSPVMFNPEPAESVLSRLDRAVDDAGGASIAVLGGLIRVFGVLLPLALLLLPVALGARHAMLRRRRAMLPGV